MRLLQRGLRERRAPEIAAGVFFAGAGVGIPLRLLGVTRAPEDPALAFWLNAGGHLLFATGAAALYLFTRQVFRPGSRTGAVLCASGVAAVALTTVAVFATGAVSDERSPAVLCTNLARVGAPAWAFVESLRYWRMMRRRVSLGLGDPVVADRFRLWALWTGALSLVPLSVALLRLAGRMLLLSHSEAELEAGIDAWTPSLVLGVRVLMAIAVPVAIYGIALSFFAPPGYVDRVRSRAGAPS